ncbi:MAG: HmuY family protein [Phocaeicola sp.]|uniref:HmuY family protein n=1 Tax=Phocaeicola TaxID=909656 RepID=UPI00234F0F21|nr:HmuY family protein [Phocaeicola oris]MCE2615894.1 HmuY family protein [Phocaeicola oris]
MNAKKYMSILAVALCLTACSKKDDPVIPVKNSTTIDASKYDQWTYINLETGQTQTLRDFNKWNYLTKGNVVETAEAQGSESDIKIKWHIAIHRYDIKTNNGQAVATTETEMDKVTTIPTSGYKGDETFENKIITDRSGMFQGKMGYAATTKLNAVLCSWLTATPTHTMPPYTYSPTNLIYIVKFMDGSYAKLKFTNYQNAEGKDGHVTFTSVYMSK